jgi:hypothetical protein
MYGHGGTLQRGRYRRLGSLLLLLLLGSIALPTTPVAHAQEQAPREPLPLSIRLDSLATGYHRGESLGFTLRDTVVDEVLYRRDESGERGVLWSARFVSRWPLPEDQLDRWSAQVIGLLADALGSDVRLAGWDRLDAADVGDRRVAYRYRLVTATTELGGEATIVVFARGEEVGLSGSATLGARTPIDAVALARLMDAAARRG